MVVFLHKDVFCFGIVVGGIRTQQSVFEQDLFVVHLSSALDLRFLEKMLLSHLPISSDSFEFSDFPEFVFEFLIFVVRVIGKIGFVLIFVVVDFLFGVLCFVYAKGFFEENFGGVTEVLFASFLLLLSLVLFSLMQLGTVLF